MVEAVERYTEKVYETEFILQRKPRDQVLPVSPAGIKPRSSGGMQMYKRIKQVDTTARVGSPQPEKFVWREPDTKENVARRGFSL